MGLETYITGSSLYSTMKEPPDKLKKEAKGTKKKRTRPDVAQKCKQRSVTVETVVKACLLKSIQGDAKQLVRDLISLRVRQFSERIKLASISLLGIIKELFDGQQDVQNVQLPNIFNQTFIRQLILGPSEHSPIQFLQEYFARHPQMLKDPEWKSLGDRNIYSAGARKYLTNLKNHFTTNFAQRILTFTKTLKDQHSLSEEERKAVFYQVCGWNIPSSFGAVFPSLERVEEIVKEHRSILGLEGKQEVTSKWLTEEATLPLLLKYFVHLNRFQEERDAKTFNIVPVSRFGASFITIDTYVLYGIAKDAKIFAGSDKDFVKLRDEQWASLFHISRYEGKSNKFTGTIDTDGTSVCFHFKRPKTVNDVLSEAFEKTNNASVALTENDRVIGVDPGRVTIMHCVEVLEDGSFREYTLTRAQYYTESGIFKARKKTNTWTKGIQPQLSALSHVTTKGMSLVDHQRFIEVFLSVYDVIQTEYFKDRWRRQRLRIYGGKKRCFDRFFTQIGKDDPRKRVVIAYGAAKMKPGGKNEVSVPVDRAFKECKKHFMTVPTPEFRSTQVFNFDDTLLRKVKSQETGKIIRGLLWSGSSTRKFIDRDLNAALNIRRCITSPTRPLSLTRDTPDLPPIPRECGIVIKF